MRSKRIVYGLTTGVMAGILAAGSAAWADHGPAQNGVTRLPNLTNGDYARGEVVEAYAEYVVSVGLRGDLNWKLFMGTGGRWCSAGESYLKALDPVPHAYTSVNNPDGRVPLMSNATGLVPSDAPLGTVDICMNNGDGFGNTAYPVGVTITRH